MSASQFWLMNAGLALVGAVLIVIFGPALRRRMGDLDGQVKHVIVEPAHTASRLG